MKSGDVETRDVETRDMETRDVETGAVTVLSVINEVTFQEFALFDVLERQRRLLRPVLFAVAFVIFSLLAFSRRNQTGGAVLLGGVLLAVGLLLPLVYLGSFYASVRRRAKALQEGEPAYSLTLDASGLTVVKGEQTLHTEWKDMTAVYRLKNCICLYTDPRHAFLLPRSCGEESCSAAWRMIEQNLTPAKIRDRAGKNNFLR